MTTEERMEIIRNKAQKDKVDTEFKEKAKQEEWDYYYDEVSKLSERIKAILELAKECGRNKVKIPADDRFSMKYDAAKRYGYDAEFFAEGIRHHVGLFLQHSSDRFDKKYPTEYIGIGIRNGGACGRINFYTDGFKITGADEDDYKKTCNPRTEDMKKFLKEFPVFESAFYNWIDSLAS